MRVLFLHTFDLLIVAEETQMDAIAVSDRLATAFPDHVTAISTITEWSPYHLPLFLSKRFSWDSLIVSRAGCILYNLCKLLLILFEV